MNSSTYGRQHKNFSTPIKTLYFYIPISGQSLRQAAVDIFRVYELNVSFVLSSRKQTPGQNYRILLCQLYNTVCHNEFMSALVFFFSLYTHQLHFKTPLEFYACDWITTLSEQQYSQTLRGFLNFLCFLFCSGASSHPKMETFFMSQGCTHPAFTPLLLSF